MSKIGFIGLADAGAGGAAGVDSINGASGALTLAGASGVQTNTVGSTLTVDGGLLLPLDGNRPMTGNLTVLGSNVNLSGTVTVGGSITSDVSGVNALGGASLAWSEVNADTGNFPLELTTNIANVSGIQFDVNVGDLSTHSPGLLFWDDSEKTLAMYTNEADVKLQLGQELWVFSRNNSGATITNLSAVIIAGAQGNRPTINLARADSDVSIEHLIGLATHDIEDNSDGYVTTNGVINNVDTTGPSGETWIDGDELYLSAVTSGNLTNIRPEAPNYVVHMGHVLNAHANQGKVLVAVAPTNFADPVTFKHIDILDGVHMYSNIMPATADTYTIGSSTSGFKEVHALTGSFNEITTTTSGTFPSGMVVVSPNGSGWLLTVDDTGAVNTSEPFVV